MKIESQWKIMDLIKRKIYIKTELKKILLKSILKNNKAPNSHKYVALWNYSKIQKNNSKTLHQNRCVISGRPWYVLKNTQYSRFVIRRESNFGNLPGFRRASW